LNCLFKFKNLFIILLLLLLNYLLIIDITFKIFYFLAIALNDILFVI